MDSTGFTAALALRDPFTLPSDGRAWTLNPI